MVLNHELPSRAHVSGYPVVPELPSVQWYSWATLSPGDINSETWSSRLEVRRGVNNPHPIRKLNAKIPEAMPAGRWRRWRSTVKAVKA
jgi:hypothetical protein